jgi:hypothetical protein
MGKSINITTPVGRMVGGSLYTPETTDYDGKPLTMKDKVTPRVNYSVAIAIPKTSGVGHWANEQWGAPIWALANEAFRNGETQRPDFAWKIVDGDSQVPNKKGRKPCDREGYPGNWVLWFSGGYAPKAYNADGTQQLMEKDAIKPGYYIQLFGSISDNMPSQSPGLYLNHTYVALSGYGPEISNAPDVGAAGFGAGVSLPPGASATPVGGFNPAAPVGYPAPPAPAAPVGYPAPPAPAAPTIPVVPNPDILTPPPPVAAPGRTMTADAHAPYEVYVANGWSDAQLIANGLMLP